MVQPPKTTRKRFNHGMFIMHLFLLWCAAWPKTPWSCIGLSEMSVNSVACMAEYGRDKRIFAGTDSNGVWQKWNDGPFELLTDYGTTTQSVDLKNVKQVYVDDPGSMWCVYAITDSGWFVYRFTSGLAPRWYKLSSEFRGSTIMTSTRDTFLIGTSDILKRTFNQGAFTSPCTVSCIQQCKPVFTSLCMWNNNVCIGSDEWVGGSLPWFGIAISSDRGRKWRDISQLVATATQLPPVYALTTVKCNNQTSYLAAATKKGIYLLHPDIDTSLWHPLIMQPPGNKINHLLGTSSTIPQSEEYFASADTGLFSYSPKIDKSWSLCLKKKTRMVTVPSTVNPWFWVAATSEGVFIKSGSVATIPYGQLAASLSKGRSVQPIVSLSKKMIYQNNFTTPVSLFLPNGRKVCTVPPRGTISLPTHSVILSKKDPF